MKKGNIVLPVWALCGAALLLIGALFWALSVSGHNPNHDINREQARAAARRVHTPPEPGVGGSGG